MYKDELINVIDECLCHFKNGATTYTRKNLIDKIVEAVDLYHNSEIKKLNMKNYIEKIQKMMLDNNIRKIAFIMDKDTLPILQIHTNYDGPYNYIGIEEIINFTEKLKQK